MNNQDVFNNFDMVIAITQKTINDQLANLIRLGILDREPIITNVTNTNTNQHFYTIFYPENNLSKKADGSFDDIVYRNNLPENSSLFSHLNGKLTPQINIHESGTTAMLILNFQSGTFGYYDGSNRITFDMSGWVFGISVNMNLAALSEMEINKKLAAPVNVKNQLFDFVNHKYIVKHLFMDFAAADMINFAPTILNVGAADENAKKQFMILMREYIKTLKDGKNPYVLAYMISATNETDSRLPFSLRPGGATYNFYKDAVNPDLSTLNFALFTTARHGTVLAILGNFNSNWIAPNEHCDTKIIYSYPVLIEKFILEPVFFQIRDGIHKNIKKYLNVGAGNEYKDAVSKISNGFHYKIKNDSEGDERYVNHYSVVITNGANGRVDIKFDGHLEFYKHLSEYVGWCTAEASASTKLDWSCTVSFQVRNDNIFTEKIFSTSNVEVNSDKNDCTKFSQFITFLESWLDEFKFMRDTDFYERLLKNVFPNSSVDDRGGDDDKIFDLFYDMGDTVNTILLLPGGNPFFMKNLATDSSQNFSIELIVEPRE